MLVANLLVSGSVVLASYLVLIFVHWLHQDRDSKTDNKKIQSDDSQLKITVKVETD